MRKEREKQSAVVEVVEKVKVEPEKSEKKKSKVKSDQDKTQKVVAPILPPNIKETKRTGKKVNTTVPSNVTKPVEVTKTNKETIDKPTKTIKPSKSDMSTQNSKPTGVSESLKVVSKEKVTTKKSSEKGKASVVSSKKESQQKPVKKSPSKRDDKKAVSKPVVKSKVDTLPVKRKESASKLSKMEKVKKPIADKTVQNKKDKATSKIGATKEKKGAVDKTTTKPDTVAKKIESRKVESKKREKAVAKKRNETALKSSLKKSVNIPVKKHIPQVVAKGVSRKSTRKRIPTADKFCFRTFYKRTEDKRSMESKSKQLADSIERSIRSRSFNKVIGIVGASATTETELPPPTKSPITFRYKCNFEEKDVDFVFSAVGLDEKTVGRIVEAVQEKFFEAQKKGTFQYFVYVLDEF